ncbi:MAG: hypothetical protein MZV64_26110 [Ignavibacteriales bacterium]|nr:hypothetical protein [Ignavibacteriales bacterium]
MKYWPAPLKEGMVLYAGHWMQFLPTRLEKVVVEGDWRMPAITLTMEKALIYPPGARIVLHYLEGGKLRVVGSLAYYHNLFVSIFYLLSLSPVIFSPFS